MGAGSCATVGREAGKLRGGLAPIRLLAGPQRIETEKRGFGVGLLPSETRFR